MSALRPFLRARLMELRNAWRRLSPIAVIARVCGVVGAVVVLVLAAPRLREPALRINTLLDGYALILMALAAVHAVLLVSRCKRQQQESCRMSWLVAAPIDDSARRRWIALNVLLAASRHLGVVVAMLGVLALLSGSFVAIPASLIAAGFCAGAIAGWYLPRRDDFRREESRYARRPRSQGSIRPSDWPLSHWPIAQTFAWHRPENARHVLLAALCAVQGGSSMLVGLGVVVTWLLAAYLVVLLQATLRVGRDAAVWLQSTPIGFAQFAWPLMRRSLAHQAIGALALSGIGLWQGAPSEMTGQLLLLWLTLVAGVTAIGLADSYRQLSSRSKLWLTTAGIAAIEWRQQGWGVILALLAATWHVRIAMKARA